MAAIAETLEASGGVFTHQAFQEMWDTLVDQPFARKELCYRLGQGAIKLVLPYRRAWGQSRALARRVGNPIKGFTDYHDGMEWVRWRLPRWAHELQAKSDETCDDATSTAPTTPSSSPQDEPNNGIAPGRNCSGSNHLAPRTDAHGPEGCPPFF